MSASSSSAASLANAIGDFTRLGRRHVSGLPVLSVVADTIATRHCVDLLAARLKQDPCDPRPHVWLAEAVIRTRRDIRTWARLRAIADPSSLVIRGGLNQLSQLGEDGGGDDPDTRLLRRAFGLAANRVRRGDTEAMLPHVLARVYLARGMPEDALRLARIALTNESEEQAEVLVTAARAFRRLGRREDAARAAEQAVEQGSTLGYEVLAWLLSTDGSQLRRAPSRHLGTWVELRRKVLAGDRERYFGAYRDGAQVTGRTASQQAEKARAALGKSVRFAGRAVRPRSKEQTP